MMTPTVVPIPCLRDNYAYLVFSPDGEGNALVIDPSESAPVENELARRGLKLGAILNTHHHWDHVGGNLELKERHNAPIYAHRSDSARVPGVTHLLDDGDEFEVAGLRLSALHVPGHTSGALAYRCGSACFTGDTLFCGGCGTLFEGTPEQMHQSLNVVLGSLPDETLVYTGHEYTEGNLRFASGLPAGAQLKSRLEEVSRRRSRGEYCASATLEVERATNPFLRVHEPELRAFLHEESEIAAFARLREMKNRA